MELKSFLPKGTATVISGPASLLNNDPKNPPDWIILEIWALESFISVEKFLLSAFLSFVLLSIIIHEADHFRQTFSDSFSELFLLYFRQQFSVVSVVYLSILRLLYSIQPFIIIIEVCCSFRTLHYCFFWLFENVVDCYSCICNCCFILPAKIICWIALESASKAFCLIQSAAISLYFFFKISKI